MEATPFIDVSEERILDNGTHTTLKMELCFWYSAPQSLSKLSIFMLMDESTCFRNLRNKHATSYFFLKKRKANISTTIYNKNDIILETMSRCSSRSPLIRIKKSRWSIFTIEWELVLVITFVKSHLHLPTTPTPTNTAQSDQTQLFMPSPPARKNEQENNS